MTTSAMPIAISTSWALHSSSPAARRVAGMMNRGRAARNADPGGRRARPGPGPPRGGPGAVELRPEGRGLGFVDRDVVLPAGGPRAGPQLADDRLAGPAPEIAEGLLDRDPLGPRGR